MIFQEKLRALMAERGISQGELSRRTHYDSGYISRIFNGIRQPSREMIHILDDALDAQGELVALAPPPPVVKPRVENGPRQGPACPLAGTVNWSPASEEGDDVKRRAALQLITALGAGTAIPPGALDGIFASLDHALGDDRADIDRWEGAVWEYGHVYSHQNAGTLINDLVSDLVELGRVLERHHDHPLERARLLRVSAGLSGLLAMEFNSLGDRRSARVAWGKATRAADRSGDPDLAAWVRAKEADGALWSGLPRSIAASLADEAVEVSRGRPSYALVRAHTVRADLAAERGDKATARAALQDLAAALEGVQDGMTADPSGHVGAVYLKWHESYVYSLLRDPRADDALESGIALMSLATTGRAAARCLELIRGLRLVKAHEIENGLEHALTAVQPGNAVTGTDPATQRHLTEQILRALPGQARTLPAARELHTLAAGASVAHPGR
ncbi:helix-turn-helix domain-containing protein [Actinomadura macra]|uniref:helix-turn-helix domain-containing protein n=1 Tax=Actinomadura macra TaxID=46164 RepID=UPI00147239AB|nr:helix-turn-helix transcriptional regulator [Actinomadura macra]